MKLVLCSDTHNRFNELSIPDGDVFIHAGDYSNKGNIIEAAKFAHEVEQLPHKVKIILPGNHDRVFQHNPVLARDTFSKSGAIILVDQEFRYEGINFYGSPWTPEYGWNWAFMRSRGREMAEKWRKIPHNVDVLITHGPPHGILDLVLRPFSESNPSGVLNVGCEELRKAVDRIRPKLHIFGHVHNNEVFKNYGFFENESTKFYNVSGMTDAPNHTTIPLNPPIVIEL